MTCYVFAVVFFMKMQLLLGTARRESESLRAELERERAALARE